MRKPNDAVRSLKRYTAEVLPDWEVRLSREEGAFKRPFARVGAAAPFTVPNGRPWMVDYVMPAFIHLYPERKGSPDEAYLHANEIADEVGLAFRVGGVGLAQAQRIPLFDYDGISLFEAAPQDNRNATDFLRVSDLSIETQPDPDEEYLTFVVVDLRLTWRRAFALDDEPLESVTIVPGP